uniref:Anaphase-promoting complex subunit 15 n=1 Tax=Timema tahoe TaxID=61484 RepID=A0A7R9IT32_9NEOP|nr:unnamed protein product [Timema tahoe]
MPVPLFPSLNPKLTDSLWFNVDKAIDEEAELTLIEQEHTTWLNNVTNEDYELIPIGKTASEHLDEEEEDDDEEDDNDDDSDSHDDEDDEELDMDMAYERDSPVGGSTEGRPGTNHSVRVL